MTDTKEKRSRAGWSAAEDAQLFERAAAAQASGAPLKGVFEAVARDTGRRPNSIRNYYYARVRTDHSGVCRHSPAFVPFSETEAVLLLESVLTAQAAGESVRSCTLRLGGGDNRAMLRYQNKYRSLVKGNPALVREVLEDLAARGIPAADPYAPPAGKRRAGRPKKAAAADADGFDGVLADLSRVDGLDIASFLHALGTLALSAVHGAEASRTLARRADETQALHGEIDRLKAELAAGRERTRTLLGYFQQLVRVNTEFLTGNSIKSADLSAYMRELRQNLESCGSLVLERQQ